MDPIDKAIAMIKTAKQGLPVVGFNHIARELNYAIQTLQGVKNVQAAIVSPPIENPHKPLELIDEIPGVRVLKPKSKAT
jgi:hypothetical protein